MLWQPTRGILQPSQHWRRPQAVGGGAPATIFTAALSGDRGDSNGSFRHVFTITGGALDQVRVTFQAAVAATANLTHAGIGISSGTTMQTTATPVELLFGGSSGFSGISSGATITSDWVNLTGFTSSDKLVVIIDFVSTGMRFDTVVTASTLWYLFGSFNTYDISDPTSLGGWGSLGGWDDGIITIEVQ